ncbi:MAG TPA: TonB-dependent receptor [Hymenobacter sp.]|jgi:TonB-linked SusC/RagA family outer membrane protein|uniref:SusC/RagA family TonB-linked outer membrane protein n=1 Tax=Hymenobacter sp. TaxID=1898978 RepID=UPI002EDA8F03
MQKFYGLIRQLSAVAWLLLLAPTAMAQAVTGKITSAEGPLPGVTVLLKGTTDGTATGVDGGYTINVPNRQGTLVFSFVGFATQEVSIDGRSEVSVVMSADAKALGEVVVVGYGEQKKSDVTGALSSVSEGQIQQVTTQNLTQALQGRAAGVDVAGSNFRPGEVPAIRIRGNRSVRASNEPLYVVDGIPLAQGSGLNDFNPQDIQSVEILKDASATAIYGSRGANGVVIVTTKRGQTGKFSLNYNTYVSADRASRTYDLYSGAEFLELQREANRTAGAYLPLYADPARDFTLFGKDPVAWENIANAYEWVDRAARVPATRPTTAEERARYGANVTQIPIYDPSKIATTDWQDLALRTAFTQNHQLSASGGTDKVRASMSVGYLNQEGIQPGQDFSRYNARVTLDYNVNSIVTLGASTNASLSIQNYGPDVFGRAAGQLPYATPYAPDGTFINNPGGDVLIFNPLREVDNAFNERRATRFFGSLYAEVKLPIEGLRYRLNVGPDFRNNRTGQFQSARAIARDAGGPNSVSFAQYDQGQNFTYVVENLLFYNKQLNENHSIGLTALQSVQQERNESSSVSALNLPYDSQKWYNLGSTYRAAANTFGSGFSQRSLMSWMGRVNYSFKDRYVLTATGRADGASVLAPGNKWSFFPSVAVAWKLQQEPFLQSVTAVNELKLRGGYGTVGQASVDPYTTGGTLQQSNYAWNEIPAYGYSPTPGTLPGTLGGLVNPDLKWERTSTINLGLDFGIFKNRVSGSVEVYRANTTDLLLPRALPAVSGVVNILQNIGETRNQGVEVSLTTVNIETASNFRWTTDFVYTRNKEEFVKLASGAQDDIGNRWFIGQPLGVYYSYRNLGIWQTEEADAAKALQAVPGDIKVQNTNGDDRINADDYVVLGSNRPKWSGSVNNTFSYKGFDLSFLVYARIGQLAASGFRPGLGGRYPGQQVNYWTPTNPSNEYPRPDTRQDQAKNSEGYTFQKGDFVRVRNISLTYTIPQSISQKVYANNLAVYVNAVNPFLFTKFKGLDPEASDIGTSSGELVQARNLGTKSLVVGLRLGF